MSGCYFKQYRLCPHCGRSHWRIFGFCNICWGYDPRTEEVINKNFYEGKEPKGKKWNKEKHDYLTSKEIKNGKKGN